MKNLLTASLQIILFSFIISCGSGIKINEAASPLTTNWASPYVDGMNGVENLVFDGMGSMFVTGLDGYIYRVEPTDDIYRGKTVAKKKIGKLCLGIEVAPNGSLYAGVMEESEERFVYKISKDFSDVKRLGKPVKGLNGFEIDKKGILYFASSNESFLFPKGGVLAADTSKDENFDDPIKIFGGAGMVNGLAFSPDESVLYFTEMTGGVKSFDMKTKLLTTIFEPSGFFQILDDIEVDSAGRLWVCINSESALLVFENGKLVKAFRPGSMRVPSSCAFSAGGGFSKEFLYVTEYGLKGRSFTRNGRGVWAVPVKEILP